jgi:hypothetical protein
MIDPGAAEGTPQVVPLTLPYLDALSSVRLYLPKDLRPPDARRLALKVPSSPSPFCLVSLGRPGLGRGVWGAGETAVRVCLQMGVMRWRQTRLRGLMRLPFTLSIIEPFALTLV